MMTFTEVALELILPLYGIKHMVAAGQLQAVEAGPKKRYIRRDEVERWKRENGAASGVKPKQPQQFKITITEPPPSPDDAEKYVGILRLLLKVTEPLRDEPKV